MKICIYSDVHWSTTTSLIRKRGNNFSVRLEYLINSMNWVNKIAVENNCEMTICAGDFMNKAQLTDEEITALNHIQWADMQHIFLCGNHESSVNSLIYNSVNMLAAHNRFIITNHLYDLRLGATQISFLPYIVESDRLPLNQYIELNPSCTKHIIISHNEINGINYGGFVSTAGFSIKEIEDSCDLYLNGHLHNSEWITKKILNVGSLSGHNFTNDSFKYKYGLWILDTDTLQLTFIENPYSLNFYKLDFLTFKDLENFNKLKQNAVVAARCAVFLYPKVKELLAENTNVLDYRITTLKLPGETDSIEDTISVLQADPIIKFIECCKLNMPASSILEQELAQICK